MTIT
ncbi:uncharacterized protein FFE2_01691 [Fusarium fujikuroi]|jgi:hypothetical protein